METEKTSTEEATIAEEEDVWHVALSAEELASLSPEPSMKVLKVGGDCILLVAGHGRYHALDARCGHRGGPLEEGDLEDLAEGLSVRCPWHGRRYRVDTGCEVLGTATAVPSQRCHRLRLDARGALRLRLAERDGSVASDQFAAIEHPQPVAPAASSLQIWLGPQETRQNDDFISDEFLF